MQVGRKLHEMNQYEDRSFPYEMYRVNKHGIVPPGRGYMDLHWHEELQFTLVKKGRVSMRVNGVLYDLSGGEAIFINCGLLHVTTDILEEGEYVSFNFPDRLLSFFPGSRMEQAYVRPFTTDYALPATVFRPDTPWEKEVIENLFVLEELMQNRSVYGWEYMISLETVQMWYVFIQNVREQAVIHSRQFIRKQQRIQELVTFVHSHYAEEINLEQIAEAAHISTGECCRCFKSMLHTTPMEYVKDYRISKSMELLRNTDHLVTEIAGMTGYNFVSHFISHFKKKTGKTPGEYRKDSF